MTLLALLALTGCGTTGAPILETKTKLVAPSDIQLLDCVTEPPPLKEAYLVLDATDREALLMNNIKRQIDQASICNVRWAGLRAWKTEQLKLIPDK